MSTQCESFRGGFWLRTAVLAGSIAVVAGLSVPLAYKTAMACSPPPSYPAEEIFIETVTGEGSYTLDPDLPSYAAGSLVTLAAAGAVYSSVYYEFDYWTGLDPIDYPSGPFGPGTSQSNPITIVVRAGQRVEPRYTRIDKLNLELYFPAANPIINPLGTPVGPNTYQYDEGTVVHVSVSPPSGYLAEWLGDLDYQPPVWRSDIDVLMNENKYVAGSFAPGRELTFSTVGYGIVYVDNGRIRSMPGPDYFFYPYESVKLQALPGWSWKFDHWEGDISGYDNPAVVRFDEGDVDAIAVFVRDKVLLSVSAEGRGAVQANPPGSTHSVGSSVTLSANPHSGWAFSHWTGDIQPGDANNPNPTITMDDDKTIEAVFVETPTLAVHILGGGKVHFGDPQDLHEGPVAYKSVAPNETVSVFAVPNAGSDFDHWVVPSGGTPSGAQLDVVMNEPKSASAVFTPVEAFPSGNANLAVAVHGAGTVNVLPPDADVTRSGVFSLPDDQAVTLTATAETGWEFVEWTGDATGTATTTQLTLSDDMAVNAYFVETGETLVGDYDLHVVVQGGGEVLTDGVLFNDGECALLIARPAFGWRFDHWEGDLTGTDGITGLEMDAAKVVTAVFVPGLSIVTDAEIIGGAVYFGPEEDWILSDPELTNMGFASAQNVTITAVPEDGYVFSHWEGDISGSSASISMSMSSHLFIRPVFLPMMPLNVIVVGGGSVMIGQGGPVVTDSYLEYYNPLQAVELTLTAAAGAGYEFDRWESTLPPSGDNILTAIMDEPVVCVVYNRKLKYRLDVNLSDPSAASVRIMPEQTEYDAGTWVEVSVYPEAGYQFTEWTGDITGTQNPVWVQINDDTEITATIEEEQPFSVYASSSDHGHVTVSPTPGPYSLRTPITVTAYPDAGYFVDHWEGDYPGAHGTSFQFAIVKDTAVHAVFATEVARPIRYLNVYARHGKGIDVTFDPLPEQGGIQKTVDQYANEYFVSYSGMYRYGTPVRLTIGGNPQQYPYQDCQLPADWFFYRSTFLQSVHAGFGKREVIYWVPADASPATIYGYCTIPATPTSSFHCTLEGEGLLRYGLGDVATPYGYTGGSVSLAGSSFVRFHAVPSPGWHFVETSWLHNGSTTLSTSPTTTVTSPASGTVAVTVHFEPDALYSLTVTEDGEGTATYSPVKPSGYGLGERVLLNATPDIGWRFVYWRNVDTDEIISCQEDYTYAIRGNTNIEAVFEALHALTITVDGRGRVGRSAYKLYYEDDEIVTLTPAANPGWVFTGWAEDASGTDNPLVVTMDGPKAITAQFEPEFNVRTDVNNDGNYTNDDDEYEPGGTQESSIGELMHLLNGIDNGTKGTLRAIGIYVHDASFSLDFHRVGERLVSKSDDLQAVELYAQVSEGTLDVDTSSTALDVRFFTSDEVFVESHDDDWTLQNPFTEIEFPFEFSGGKPLRQRLYMFASGQLSPGTHETFDLVFTLMADGKQYTDTIRVTVSSGLGDNLFANVARDYVVEHEDVVYYTEQLFPESQNFPGAREETYCMVMMPHEKTVLTALDLGFEQNPPLNIEEVCSQYSDSLSQTVITTGLYCLAQHYPGIPERTNGAVIQDKKVRKTAAFRFPPPPYNEHGEPLPEDPLRIGHVAQPFVSQTNALRRLQIGHQFGDIHINGPGATYPPADFWTIPIYVDNPQAWDTQPGFTSPTHQSAFYGLPDTTLEGHDVGASSFITLLPEFDADLIPEGGGFVCIAMTRLLSLTDYAFSRGRLGQTDAFVQAAFGSGAVGDALLRLDGGASPGMAVKSPLGYSVKTHAPRHDQDLAASLFGFVNNYMLFNVGTTDLVP